MCGTWWRAVFRDQATVFGSRCNWSMPSRGINSCLSVTMVKQTDLFTMQDDISFKVLGAILVKLTGTAPVGMKYYKGTHGLDCFLKFQEAISYLQRMTLAGTHQAQQIAEECLAMCPEISNVLSHHGPLLPQLLLV